MKKYTWAWICWMWLPLWSLAHNGVITGKVTDPSTHLPVSGASVSLVEKALITATDERGVYEFSGLESGAYTLKISFFTYETKEIRIDLDENKPASLDVELKPVGMDLPQVEIRGQLTPEKQLSTISAIDIQLRPARSSQDVLRLVPGLFIAQHAGGGKAEQIFLRGFDVDHGTDVRLEVDGMPVNMVSHAHGQGYADLHFLIPETIEEVDFAKGLYDPRYGNFTTAGHVNFQTKRALDRSSFKLEAGQFNTLRAVGLFNLIPTQPRHHAYLAGEWMMTDGYFESPQNFTRLNAMARYHGLLDDNHILTATLSTFTSQWDASGQIPERAVRQGLISRFGAIDDTEGGQTSRSNVNLQLTRIQDNGTVIKNQLYYTRYDFELYSNFTFFLEDPENSDQIRQKEGRNIVGYKGSMSRRHQLGPMVLQSEAGLGLRYDQVEDNELSHTLNRSTTLQRLAYGDVRELNLSAYLDEHLLLTDQLSVKAGLRYDRFRYEYQDQLQATYGRQSVWKGMLSPKLGLYYTPNQRLRLYVNAGKGFHSNDTRVVLAQTSRAILPAAYGSDVGLIMKPFDRLLVQAGLWGLWLEQEFVYVGDAGVVEPSGRSRRLGVDLSLRAQLAAWLFADLDLNYTHPRSLDEPEGARYIPLAPTFTSIGGLSARWKNGLSASLRYRYLKDRPANETYSLTAEGYLLLDAVLKYSHRQFELGLSMENLLNAEWKEAQFETESRLRDEALPVSEIHFTPGSPFFARLSVAYLF